LPRGLAAGRVTATFEDAVTGQVLATVNSGYEASLSRQDGRARHAGVSSAEVKIAHARRRLRRYQPLCMILEDMTGGRERLTI
jgi:hypothetical protein